MADIATGNPLIDKMVPPRNVPIFLWLEMSEQTSHTDSYRGSARMQNFLLAMFVLRHDGICAERRFIFVYKVC